jgi:hypothetical protein
MPSGPTRGNVGRTGEGQCPSRALVTPEPRLGSPPGCRHAPSLSSRGRPPRAACQLSDNTSCKSSRRCHRHWSDEKTEQTLRSYKTPISGEVGQSVHSPLLSVCPLGNIAREQDSSAFSSRLCWPPRAPPVAHGPTWRDWRDWRESKCCPRNPPQGRWAGGRQNGRLPNT